MGVLRQGAAMKLNGFSSSSLLRDWVWMHGISRRRSILVMRSELNISFGYFAGSIANFCKIEEFKGCDDDV